MIMLRRKVDSLSQLGTWNSLKRLCKAILPELYTKLHSSTPRLLIRINFARKPNSSITLHSSCRWTLLRIRPPWNWWMGRTLSLNLFCFLLPKVEIYSWTCFKAWPTYNRLPTTHCDSPFQVHRCNFIFLPICLCIWLLIWVSSNQWRKPIHGPALFTRVRPFLVKLRP